MNNPSQMHKCYCLCVLRWLMRPILALNCLLQIERKLLKGIFFFYFEHWRPSCSLEWNSLSNFSRGSPKEYSCEIILKTIHQFRRKSCLNGFLFLTLAIILFSQAEQFEQFWLRVTPGTFLWNYFKIHSLVKEEKSF